MARLSFEKKRDLWDEPHPAAPVEVRVSGSGSASVGGVAVMAAPGQEIQQAVLNHLQRLAISLGRPVHAMVHDERVGCVVPLEVDVNGASRFTGEPRLHGGTTAPQPAGPTAPQPPGPAAPQPARAVTPAATSEPPRRDTPPPEPVPLSVPPTPDPASGPDTRHHTPARGFDAVAEAVLGDGPVTATAEGAALLTEPMTRINEAVKEGRIGTAAELAERTVVRAADLLGAGHPEVLRLRELSAYIAYLADDPLRAFHLSLDLARLHQRARNAEAAYGNLQSAATAWRAVRDPEHGLSLGRDLIELWTELAAAPGPAADDRERLESARARMVRLTDRAARAAGA
ncbi:hypothetical protein ABZX30_14150 [Streptomyces sp. NPDC004542]|uniref:hypothetical protein n=1 Tax=Streptomyces sp. NPDC004542 TaxID=3154281 RepID=UPI0033B9851A